jgi:toxin ParE1/3/4
MEKTFVLLAENPKMGVSCNNLVVGMRRFIVGKHMVYYREETNTIIIHRIVHQTRQMSSDMLQ